MFSRICVFRSQNGSNIGTLLYNSDCATINVANNLDSKKSVWNTNSNTAADIYRTVFRGLSHFEIEKNNKKKKFEAE